MSPRLLVTALSALLVSFLGIGRASAQTIDVVQEASLARLDASGAQIPKRPLHLAPEAINRQDCLDDQRIRFTLQMTGFHATSVVEAWASTGADCRLPEARTESGGSCWRLAPNVPLQQTVDLVVPVRTILSPTSDPSVCGKVDLTVIDVQLMMFAASSDAVPVATKSLSITADTVGPAPPRASVFPGNGRARVELTASGSLSAVTSVSAFCERSASPGTCAASALVPGEIPDDALECGTVVGAGARSLHAGPLANDAPHVVAVAARDAFGNLGPLSTITCATPRADAEPAADVDPDGAGGCAIGRAHAPRGATATLMAAGLALLVAARRREGNRVARAYDSGPDDLRLS